MFASFRDLSGVYAEDDDYYGHDTGAGTLNDIYEAYGYGDEYSDGHFSDGEDIRNFWFGNGSAECAEDAEQTETDDVADPSIEEIDSVEEEPPQSARLLLEYHAPDAPSAQDESSDEDSFEDSQESPPNDSDEQRETTVDDGVSNESQTTTEW